MSRKHVIAWGTGGLARDGLRAILDHPDLELVGVVTSSPEKIGKDAAELAGVGAPTGVLAVKDGQSLLHLKADCIAYFANSANRDDGILADVLPFLESGTNVSTISHFDLQYPRHGRPRYVAPIEAACRKGGTSIFLTGDDPGWAFGQLLFTLLSFAGRIERIDMMALANVRNYGALASLKMYGFAEPLEFRPPMFTSPDVGGAWHMDTLRGIADFLNVEVDDYRQTWETAAVDFDFESAAYGTVKAGQTAGTYWTVTAIVGGKPFLVYHKLLRLHEAAGPDWPQAALAASGLENSKRIRITGSPTFETELTRFGGLSMTSLAAVTAIPWVCDARPGILEQSDVPLFPARMVPTGPARTADR